MPRRRLNRQALKDARQAEELEHGVIRSYAIPNSPRRLQIIKVEHSKGQTLPCHFILACDYNPIANTDTLPELTRYVEMEWGLKAETRVTVATG